jgi:hypothetical protein
MNIVSLSGLVEKIEGKLVLLIPLEVGGADLAQCAWGIGENEGRKPEAHYSGVACQHTRYWKAL